MLGRHWAYARAAFAGVIAGLMLFVFKQFVRPGSLSDQLLELCLAIALGALAFAGAAWLRNHWWRQVNRRHDVTRSIDILPK